MTEVILANRYELQEFLGEGGMGVVYRGEDLETGRRVAIKLLKPEVVVRFPEQAERFRREAEALVMLDHPNVVRVLNAFTENDQDCIVMEYMGGGSLRSLLKQEKRLDIVYTLNVALDLCDALTRTHRLKIIHRDLKPDNVLLSEQGIPKLTDFGQAHISNADTLTQVGQVMGTINYMAPETLQRQPIDPRTDIWCFGIMLYEMLSGFRPFMADNPAQLMKAILHQPVPDLLKLRQDCPPRLATMIHKMLEKNPDQRFSSIREVGVEIEAILEAIE